MFSTTPHLVAQGAAEDGLGVPETVQLLIDQRVAVRQALQRTRQRLVKLEVDRERVLKKMTTRRLDELHTSQRPSNAMPIAIRNFAAPRINMKATRTLPSRRKRDAFMPAARTPRGDQENLYWSALSAASGAGRPPQSDWKLTTWSDGRLE